MDLTFQVPSPKGDQPWNFSGRNDTKAETPVLWPPHVETEGPIVWPLDVKSQLVRKDPDTGKVRRRKEKGTTEDEMVGWHH